LFLLWASNPVAAAEDELRVIAVHTASAPRVSMVVEAPPALLDHAVTSDELFVTVDGEPVATSVTPMASSALSVALVVDTGSGMTADELAAVQSGATEFLLRLPPGAHTAVVNAGDDPEVVAPLSTPPAEALTAVSALRGGRPSSAAAGVLRAAEALQGAPPGPRVIIVYSRGVDKHGVLAEKLSQAISQAEAVVNVLLTGADPIWERVVDRTGGTVVHTGASQVVRSYAGLATALSDQYLVAFKAPGELPTVAEVILQAGEHEYRSVVLLPTTSTTEDAEGQSSKPSPAVSKLGSIVLIFVGMAATALIAFVYIRHARQTAAAPNAGPPAEGAAPAAGAPPPDHNKSNARPGVSVASPPPRTVRRASLSAAVQGRRLAQQALRPDPGDTPRRPPNDVKPQADPDNRHASSPVPNHFTSAAVSTAQPPQATPPQRNGSGNNAGARNAEECSAENSESADNG
jgi:hypothetical protein